MKIKIPFKTPTYNHLYWHRGNMKILKTEAKKIREEIKEIVFNGNYKDSYPKIFLSSKLKVCVEIHENWFTKKGDVKRKDISNREKFLIDSIFDALELDDKFIFEHTMKKIQSEEEFAIINIEELKE